jgi:hypothetical protein
MASQPPAQLQGFAKITVTVTVTVTVTITP